MLAAAAPRHTSPAAYDEEAVDQVEGRKLTLLNVENILLSQQWLHEMLTQSPTLGQELANRFEHTLINVFLPGFRRWLSAGSW